MLINQCKSRDDKMNTAQDFFRNNLHEILHEKGINRKPEMIKFIENLAVQNERNITSGIISRWVYEGALPRWTTLEMLADWLDCEVSDLLPSQYHHILKGNNHENS